LADGAHQVIVGADQTKAPDPLLERRSDFVQIGERGKVSGAQRTAIETRSSAHTFRNGLGSYARDHRPPIIYGELDERHD
jgi:hypothetical protein